MAVSVTTRDGRIVRTMSPGELLAELSLGVERPIRAKRSGRRPTGGRSMHRLAGVLGVMTVLLLGVSSVFAVHDQDFELDGNAQDSAPGLPDDWSNVFAGNDNAIISTFVDDPLGGVADPDEIFTTGGSKDDLDIAAGGTGTVGPWAWTIGNVPDKDNIEDAFAAAYNCDDFPSGGGFGDANSDPDLCLYFGLDRFANNGDAQVGFWFFQSDHSRIGTTGGLFENPHDIGDVLILSDFTNGGVVSTIRVFKWVGTGGDTNGTLDNVFNGVACSTTTAPDVSCAQANTASIPSPWPYTPKSGAANTLPKGSFFEGGVNLSALGLDIGCGASFLAETRSSQSVDATLKDFAEGSFSLCGIEVTKSGDTLSKVGDSVDYSITVENTGSVTLYKQSITDTLLGSLTGNAGCGASLAPGATCTINTSRTVQAGDPDPLPNTVTAIYDSSAALDGSEVNDSDDHSVNLFQPSITVDKSGDALSKVGDSVNYTITVSNTSSTDTPAMSCTITDPQLGVSKTVTIANGASDVTNASRTTQAGDTDPFVNTASASCTIAGFPNVLTGSDSHSVNLFQPSIDIDKTGDTLSKVGDSVDYTITVTNTSSADSPACVGTVTDAMLGISQAINLAPGASTTINASRTVVAGDPDPVVNTASVSCSPTGYPNVLTDSDSHSVNLFQPSIDLDKTGDATSKVGDSVDYSIVVTNTSSADSPNCVGTVTDAMLGISQAINLAPGASTTINASRTVVAGDPDPLINTASVTCSPVGFPNVLTDSDSHSVNLFQPSITFDKTGDALSKVGDPVSYTITLNNTSSADSPNLSCTITDVMLGISKSVNLAAGATDTTTASYTVLPTDTDPLLNTASVSCTVDGFPNTLTGSDGHSVNLFQPAVSVVKTGPATASVGDTVTYHFVITNTGSSDSPSLVLDSVTDTVIGDLTAIAAANGCTTLTTPGGSCAFDANYTIPAGSPDPLVNVVTVHYHPADFPNDITASDDHSLDILAGEGCTPGFWKNHTEVWDDTDDQIFLDLGITTDTLYSAAFGLPAGELSAAGLSETLTLEQAINTGGGGFQALVRHSTAALLNSGTVAYPYSTAQVIAGVQAAFANDDANYNGFLDAISAANNLPHDSCPQSDPSD